MAKSIQISEEGQRQLDEAITRVLRDPSLSKKAMVASGRTMSQPPLRDEGAGTATKKKRR